MTVVNSLGVCAAYSTFIGSTMATLAGTSNLDVCVCVCVCVCECV
jgi:amino acid permease